MISFHKAVPEERAGHCRKIQDSRYMEIAMRVRPGGEARYSMEFNNHKSWGKASYKEVIETEKLVFIVSFTDENGQIITHSGAPNWPREVLSTVIP